MIDLLKGLGGPQACRGGGVGKFQECFKPGDFEAALPGPPYLVASFADRGAIRNQGQAPEPAAGGIMHGDQGAAEMFAEGRVGCAR